MKRILIYRHPECQRCARFARMHQVVDWLNRIESTTAQPPTGPLRPGQIVVEDLRNGRLAEGVDALRLIYRNIIPYWPLLVLLWIPPTRAWLDRSVRGGVAPSSERQGRTPSTAALAGRRP